MAKKPDGSDHSVFDALVESAAQVLAPNSLQFNENEFQSSPKLAQDAARDAAKLVQPGDLIFITTSGFIYSLGRYLTANDYDHVVVVLDDKHVLNVGMPAARLMPLERLLLPQRQPVVLRVPMTDDERAKFLRCARELVGRKYDVVRWYQLVLRLTLKNFARATPLKRLPMDLQSDTWICSDSIMVLLTGCSARFRDALVKARQTSQQLDVFTFGSASLSDFTRLRQLAPDVLARVELPLVDYTLLPQSRPWRAHIPDVIHVLTKIQAGTFKWPQIDGGLFPKLEALSKQLPPAHWPLQMKAKVMGYALVLLVVLKRGVTVSRILLRMVQIVLLRYLAQQLLRHLDRSVMAKSMLSKL